MTHFEPLKSVFQNGNFTVFSGYPPPPSNTRIITIITLAGSKYTWHTCAFSCTLVIAVTGLVCLQLVHPVTFRTNSKTRAASIHQAELGGVLRSPIEDVVVSK